MPVESLLGFSLTSSLPIENLAGLSLVKNTPLENLVYLSIGNSQPIDFIANISPVVVSVPVDNYLSLSSFSYSLPIAYLGGVLQDDRILIEWDAPTTQIKVIDWVLDSDRGLIWTLSSRGSDWTLLDR